MFWIPLILIAPLVANGLSEYASNCLMPDKQEGICMPIESCKSFNKSLKQNETTSEGEEMEAIKKLDCGTFSNVTHVCCAAADLQLNPEGLNILKAQNCGIAFPHIAYGRQADLGEFPWMSLVIYKKGIEKKYICGGTIITDRYILTAAHCLRGKPKDQLTVRLGEYRISIRKVCKGIVCSEPVDIKVEEVISHPKFENYTNDISLIRLQRKANFTLFIRPICLPIYDKFEPPEKFIISGWGDTEDYDFGSDVLMYAVVYPIEISVCNAQFHLELNNETNICATGNGLEDTCAGDSGGPLGNLNSYETEADQRFVQYGVISGGVDACGDYKSASFYIRVKYYLQWITDTIKP